MSQRRRVIAWAAGTLSAAALAATLVAAEPGVQTPFSDPGYYLPLVECLNAEGNPTKMVVNPLLQIPGDANTAGVC